MSKPMAIFFPTHCYFSSERQLEGEEFKHYVLIDALYANLGRPLFVYSNRALELAVADGHDILFLDTGVGSPATQAYLAAEIERLNNEKMKVYARAVGFAEFLDIASADCLEVMRSVYDMCNLEWNYDWRLWPSAYWKLGTFGTTTHGSSFGLPRPA